MSDVLRLFEMTLDQFFPSQGFILLDQDGSLVRSTTHARQLCQRLWAGAAVPAENSDPIFLPTAIQERSKVLIESREQITDREVELQDEVALEDATRIRIQAKWIKLDPEGSYFILVTLTDLVEVAANRARLDAFRYCFTPKETEVWELRLQELSYREICQHQYISENTVKRHIKSINSKRKSGDMEL